MCLLGYFTAFLVDPSVLLTFIILVEDEYSRDERVVVIKVVVLVMEKKVENWKMRK